MQPRSGRPATISELLGVGPDKAITGAALSDYLMLDYREVCAHIERERRQGEPICASSKGYFLAAGPEDLQNYCETIKRRAISLFKTRQALLKTIQRGSFKDEKQH